MFEQFSSYWQQTLNWQPTPAQEQGFAELYNLVLAGNQTQNLTRITDEAEFWEKHLWDSLRGVLEVWEHPGLKVIDIGTGAGFPGLPIAIAQPSWHLSLLDSKAKKTNFIRSAVESLGLEQVSTFTGRAEALNQLGTHFQKYDLALTRAVGSAALCAQYTLPFLKVGGIAILYRGQWTEFEQLELEDTCHQFVNTKIEAKITRVESFTTPLTASQRHCIHIYKVAHKVARSEITD
ncbi:16S rRNA (guanine(527)-N(7))-methyltransferase RsmG [Pseudanabaena sp. PCC 6802]|uniref:16S rRNA (guanine(527)-N(7))-methyltransferase RsmG n=1 Tax=Pseudanabaena sp. PCC 6802 TaxID=118173 RepID=UPI00034A76F0|nr:16S rRNA (guanine(527)-N(7))-methyltransferase RsmG [Pseudanabaena sp. PCC 6802]